MKILTVITLILLSGCSSMKMGKKEIVWQALHAMDVAQTLQIAKNSECYHEGNALTKKVIGKDPSEKNVIAWGVGMAIAYHYLNQWIDNTFPKRDGDVFRFMFTGDKVYSVWDNYNAGLYLTHSDGCN